MKHMKKTNETDLNVIYIKRKNPFVTKELSPRKDFKDSIIKKVRSLLI